MKQARTFGEHCARKGKEVQAALHLAGAASSPGSCVIWFPESTLVYSRNSQSYENTQFIRLVLKLIVITPNTSVWKVMQ